jgi:hypothetical protein
MDSFSFLLRVIVTDNTNVGRVLVAIVTIIAIVAAMAARRHHRRYRGTETAYLQQVKTRLGDLLAPLAPEAVAKEAGQSAPPSAGALAIGARLVSAEELAASVPPACIIGDRLHMIARLRKSQTKVNLTALQQVSRAKEAAKNSLRFPGFAVNILMLIGLLGTFVGIAIVIEQIGVNIGRGDGSLQSFSLAFGGMYTKFATTLVALAGAIVLAILNFRLAQAQEAYFEELDRFTVAELLPATIPALEDETLLERISQRLEESFTLIQDIADRNAKTAEEVQAIQSGFTEIINNIRQQTRAEGAGNLQNLLGHVAGVIDQVSQVNLTLRQVASSLPETLTESNRRIERVLTERVTHTSRESHRLPQTVSFLALGAAVVLLFITILAKG